MTMNVLESHNCHADETSINGQSSQNCESQQSETKLQEMGEALEMAETRCNTLKGQLDQVKNLYRERTNENTSDLRPAKPDIVRVNSKTINTDKSGAAVLTINNILSGITNSINRLSELHTCMEGDSNAANAKRASGVPEAEGAKSVTRRSSSGMSSEVKREMKRRLKRSRQAEDCPSTAHMRRTSTKCSRITLREDGVSTSSMKHRRRHRRPGRCNQQPQQQQQQRNTRTTSCNRLVEIYHNAALDYAESDELIQAGRQRAEAPSTRYATLRREIHIPQLSVCEQPENDDGTLEQLEPTRSLSPIKEHGGVEQMAAPEEHPRLASTHYQSPTISSRMKRVARGYFRHFACKTIPFCAAKSTSPSHNIGINIQQVMSIMKGRHVLDAISPTLAHNIGLAADRLRSGCLSAVVSSYSARMGHTVQPCPMLPHLNMELLRAQATEVPQEEVSRSEEFAMEVADKVRSQGPICWAMETSTQNDCTCVQHSGLDFNEVLQKYQQHTANSTPKQIVATILQNSIPGSYNQRVQRYTNRKYRHIRSVYAQYNDKNRRNKGELEFATTDSITNGASLDSAHLPLNGKERILKGVLMNLHSEFSNMSEKYDALTCNAEANTDEIASLEKQLNEKEVEIQMVMSLYNEVMKLTEQLRVLKEDNRSIQNRVNFDQRQMVKLYENLSNGQEQLQQDKIDTPMQSNQLQSIFTNYRYPQAYRLQPKRDQRSSAAMHLTKLLRQIQAYQDVFRTGAK